MSYTPTRPNSWQGTAGGIVGLDGSSFVMKVSKFDLHVRREQTVWRFFGGGNIPSVTDGFCDPWSAYASGELLSGTNNKIGIGNLQGTTTVYGSVTLVADGGRTFTGSARVEFIDLTVDHARPNAPARVHMIGGYILSENNSV